MTARPRGFENWNRALRGAFLKGEKARADGEPISACPYADRRKLDGRLTWSRAFEAAWRDGWNWVDELARLQALDEYYRDRNNSPYHASRSP